MMYNIVNRCTNTKKELMNFIFVNYRTILTDIILIVGCITFVVTCIYLLGIKGDFVLNKTAILATIMLVIGRHLYMNKKYWFAANIFIMLIANATIAIQGYAGLNVDVRSIIITEAFIITTSNVILAMSNSFSHVMRYLVSFLMITAFLLLMLLFWEYYFAEHIWLAADALLAIMQTDQSEAFSYLIDHYSINMVICIIMVILFIAIFTIYTAKYGGVKRNSHAVRAFSIFFILINILLSIRMVESSYVTAPLSRAKQGLELYENFAKLRDTHNSSILVNAQKQDDYPGVYVLIIGESQAKEHMQAYGYSRENTPWLTHEVENGDAILFQKAFSCQVQTVPALTYALTEKNQYNQNKIEACSSLIDNLNSAGYQTIWLSNQVQYGVYDTPIRVIADSAKEKIFINRNMGTIAESDYYDEKLVESMNKSL